MNFTPPERNNGYCGATARWTKKKNHGPVWFTMNPSVKIHRETQKNDFFNKY